MPTSLRCVRGSSQLREPQRRAFTHVDETGERTITVLGDKLRPSGEDASLPWEELARCDAVYFVSGDVAALRAARRAPVLVATSRVEENGTTEKADPIWTGLRRLLGDFRCGG